jgi:hypothetical protein
MAYETGPRTPGEKEEVNVLMCVVPEPPKGERNVLVSDDERQEPLMVGTGQQNFLCGNCRAVLAGSMGPEEIEGAPLFRCYRCGSYNEIP